MSFRLFFVWLVGCLISLVVASVPVLAEESPFQKQEMESQFFERIAIGRAQDVSILLERGADPNRVNSEGRTPIALAIERQDEEGFNIVKVLIEGGADINYNKNSENNPLLLSIKHQQEIVVWYLLFKGANFYVRNEQDQSALDLAKETGNAKIIEMMEEAIAFDKKRHDQQFPREVQQFSFYNCAHRYIQFYIASGQDDLTSRMDALKQKLVQQQNRIKELKDYIRQTYNVDSETLDRIMSTSQELIATELREMVSNKNRRAKGVGTNDDLIERCTQIASSWAIKKKAEGPPPASPLPR